MSLEERLEQAENLVAEVKAELAAMRATKRNWPERIEAGMIFKAKFTEATWMATGRGTECMCIANGEHGGWGVMNDVSDALAYLGHARDILTIRTDAHEPTGAELVGRAVEVTNDPSDTTWGRTYNGKPIVVTDYRPDHTCPYKAGEAGNWRFARLKK